MKKIQTFSQIEVMDNIYPKWAKYLIILILFIFLIIAIYLAKLLFEIFDNNQIEFKIKFNLLLSVILLLLFIPSITYSLFSRGVYKPKKSFAIERFNKIKLNFVLKSLLVIYFAYFLWDLYSFGFNITKRMGGYLSTFIASYYVLKSIKYHEDVDYTANQTMNEILQMDINEVITASYQNFDSTEPIIKKGDSIIIVTNQRIYFAQFNGSKFENFNKSLIQIEKVGISRKLEESFLLLKFEDKTTLSLVLNVIDKTITSPQLFISQFLNTLDNYLLGDRKEIKPNRRRVSFSNINNTITDNFSKQSRNIEINPTLVSELKASEEIKSGRILEI